MSDLWNSARQALGYMYSAKRGPTMRRPRWNDASASTGHGKWDHVLVGALLYGGLEVEPGSELDEEIWTWALDREAVASPRVRDIVQRLTQLMDEHDMLADQVPDRAAFVVWTYHEGKPGRRMRDALELAAVALQHALMPGPRPSAEVKAELVALGFSPRTITRALERAGVLPSRTATVPARTLWSLGSTAERHAAGSPAP